MYNCYMIQFSVITVQVLLHSCQEVNLHRNHPDAKPLDEEIAEIARRELKIGSCEGIQVVDDLVRGQPVQSWGILPFGSLARPIIAVQKGLVEHAGAARRFFILRELHKLSNGINLVKMAKMVMTVSIGAGIVAAGGAFYLVAGKLLLLFVSAKLSDFALESYFNAQGEAFAMQHVSEKEQITRVVKVLIDGRRKLGEFVWAEKVEVTEPLPLEISHAFTPLDLPVKLRRPGETEYFLKKREKFHLQNLMETRWLGLGSAALASLFLMDNLKFLNMNHFLLFAMINNIVRPIMNRLAFYYQDSEFMEQSFLIPHSEGIAEDPAIWKGFLE